MTREEIEEAARKESGRWAPNPVHVHDIYRRDDFEVGFYEGAEWIMSRVWHSANATCTPKKQALVIFKNGTAKVYNDLRNLTYERLWGEVEKFAYIEDLIFEMED